MRKMQRESVDLTTVQRQIATVLDDHEGRDREVSLFTSFITKKHWKPDESRSRCASPKCNKRFSLIERRSHCRLCGDVFCSSCCQFKRKLNTYAQPDPHRGRMHRVRISTRTLFFFLLAAAGVRRLLRRRSPIRRAIALVDGTLPRRAKGDQRRARSDATAAESVATRRLLLLRRQRTRATSQGL